MFAELINKTKDRKAAVEKASENQPAKKPTGADKKYYEIDYWDQKYAEDEKVEGSAGTEFEWIAAWEHLKSHLLPALAAFPHPNLLHIGCGNSRLAVDLLLAGVGKPPGKFEVSPGQFEDVPEPGTGRITNVDLSAICIEQMKKRFSLYTPPLVWQTQDVLKMDFDAGSFDVVLDKGMADAFMTDSVHGPRLVGEMMDSCWTLLREKGVVLVISFGVPVTRTKELMGSKPWKLTHEVIKIPGKPFQYFYTLEKNTPPSE